ncbi:hypothetical protein AMS68_000387 [Peltaster fructicola]|uniref:Glycosyl transferase family 17 protein n=1 Tax=Peltaster fructicola TaxID=286661 RepID=A0A6H0XK29_9PEZI|nr:hypothetical protein AMS68_000387 [Peltaster fructicola]
MSRARGLLKLTSVRIVLFVFLVLLLIAWPAHTFVLRSSSFQHLVHPVPDRDILLHSPLFTTLDPGQSRTLSISEEAVDALCQAHHFPAWHKPGRKVYDLVLITNELDWLEIRLHTLAPYVDYFVVVESTITFTGIEKELVLQNNWDRFKEFHHKIIHHIVEAKPATSKDWDAWDHEAAQRNAMLTDVFPQLVGSEKEAKKGDVILVSDLDELVRPETAILLRHCDYPARLTIRTRFFYYAYQWRYHNGDWSHPQATTYGGSVGGTILPQALRTASPDRNDPWSWSNTAEAKLQAVQSTSASLHDGGWHCSSCYKTIGQVQRKIIGFSHTNWNTEENRDPATIIHRYKNGLDLFGREDELYDKTSVTDVPEYVSDQFNATGRFGYLLDRTTKYAEFEDAEDMLTVLHGNVTSKID